MSATATTTSPTPARARPRWRGWLGIGLALVAALTVAVWSTVGNEEFPTELDPRNPGPEGAQAVARVLEDEGVEVTIVRSADAFAAAQVAADTTVVVTRTDALSASSLERLVEHADPGGLVLVDASWELSQELARLLDVDLSASRTVPGDPVAAACTSPAPALDGLTLDVDLATAYTSTGGDTDGDEPGCFATDEGNLLLPVPGHDVLLFGAGAALANENVLRKDNAAVALHLLGGRERLIWYVPDPTDSEEPVTLGSLAPRWIGPALWLVTLSLIALALWRGRRLGPLSIEPLPVVVRAVETARSRGRMYRRAGDRAHAAAELRRAAAADLAAHLRLDRHADAATVAQAAAHHLGRPVEPIALLLDPHQSTPARDQDLVQIAQELARLRKEVRRG